MTILESLILGAIQGITEFLPISSSAHLIIVPYFFKIDTSSINKLTYDVMLHFGTLIAVLCLYGKKFVKIVTDGILSYRNKIIKKPMLSKLFIASLPAGFAGLFFQTTIENHLRVPAVTVVTLIVVSFIMIIAERITVKSRNISYAGAILIGFAQAFALIPGVSRSGITIVAGILLGLKREEAVDFSFLLSIPIILGTSLYEVKNVSFNDGGFSLYIAGALSAFAFGALSLIFLIRFLKRHTLDLFAVYRILLALGIVFSI